MRDFVDEMFPTLTHLLVFLAACGAALWVGIWLN